MENLLNFLKSKPAGTQITAKQIFVQYSFDGYNASSIQKLKLVRKLVKDEVIKLVGTCLYEVC
jgi:hypothetical protein